MTVQNTLNKHTYVGNGATTSFPYTFKIFKATDIQVIITDVATGTDELITTNYYVNTTDKTVTYPTSGDPLTSAYEITLNRSVPITQETALPNNGPYLAKVIENALDKGTIINQQQQEQIDRVLKLAVSAADGVSKEFPPPIPNKVIRWNSTATELENAPDSADSAAQAAASAAVALVAENNAVAALAGLETEMTIISNSVSYIQNSSREKQYALIDMANSNVKIQYKYYQTEDRVIELAKCGVNNIFSFYQFSRMNNSTDTIYPSGDFNAISLIQTLDTDLIGPIQVEAVSNANGDNPSVVAFTGGWHGYNGDQTGTSTARHVSLDVFVDGKKITGTFSGYCEKVLIKSVSNIQAYNTKKADGTGREVLQQEITWLFIAGKCEVHIRLIALENINIIKYYGLQTVNNGEYQNSTVHYLYGDSTGRKPTTPQTGDVNNSGTKTAYPNVDRIAVRSPSGNDFIVWVDNSYGLGQRLNVSGSVPLAFTSGYKSYFNLVNGITLNVLSNTPVEIHGGFCFTVGTQTQTNCDMVATILKNGLLWRVYDFLGAGSEYQRPLTDEVFLSGNALDVLKKDTNVTGLTANYFYTWQVDTTGYGSYWFRFKGDN